MDHEDSYIKDERPQIQPLTGKDITDFGKEVGRDSVKQAVVWAMAGYLTKGLRYVVDKITRAGK